MTSGDLVNELDYFMEAEDADVEIYEEKKERYPHLGMEEVSDVGQW